MARSLRRVRAPYQTLARRRPACLAAEGERDVELVIEAPMVV
jgi:hypothetical protein